MQLMVYCDKVQSNTITIHVLDYDKLKKQATAAEQPIAQIGEVTLQSGEAIVIAGKPMMLWGKMPPRLWATMMICWRQSRSYSACRMRHGGRPKRRRTK